MKEEEKAKAAAALRRPIPVGEDETGESTPIQSSHSPVASSPSPVQSSQSPVASSPPPVQSSHSPVASSPQTQTGKNGKERPLETGENARSGGSADQQHSAPREPRQLGPHELRDLPKLAEQFLREIHLPVTWANREAVRGALQCEIDTGNVEWAYHTLLRSTEMAREQHLCEVNRFFFEDRKYASDDFENRYWTKKFTRPDGTMMSHAEMFLKTCRDAGQTIVERGDVSYIYVGKGDPNSAEAMAELEELVRWDEEDRLAELGRAPPTTVPRPSASIADAETIADGPADSRRIDWIPGARVIETSEAKQPKACTEWETNSRYKRQA